MRVVRVHAPGAEEVLAAAVAEAVRAFNGALDIRLRFLAIGIEETVLAVADAASAAEAVGAALESREGRTGADVVLILGDGDAAVAAATVARRAQVPALRVGAGDRPGPDPGAARAVDRICSVLLARGAEAVRTLREEGVTGEIEDVGEPGDPATGERIVRALARARRR